MKTCMDASASRFAVGLLTSVGLATGANAALNLTTDVVVKSGDGCPSGYRVLLHDELGEDWGVLCWEVIPNSGHNAARIHHKWENTFLKGIVETEPGCRNGWGGDDAKKSVTATLCVATSGSAPATADGSTPSVAPKLVAAVGASDWVTAHNAERTKVGTPPLVWDDGVAAVAKEWAEKLARESNFEHRRDTTGFAACKGGCGENLAMTMGQTSYSAQQAVDQWLSERPDWDSRKASTHCLGGKVCGHYTQIISKLSTKVGCAIAKGKAYSAGFEWYAVCNYHSHGNMTGERIVP